MTENNKVSPASPSLQTISNAPLESREDVIESVKSVGQKLDNTMDGDVAQRLGSENFLQNHRMIELRTKNMAEMLGDAFDREKTITPRMISYFMGEDKACTNHAAIRSSHHYVDGKTEAETGGPSFREKRNIERIDVQIDNFHEQGCQKSIYEHETHSPSNIQR